MNHLRGLTMCNFKTAWSDYETYLLNAVKQQFYYNVQYIDGQCISVSIMKAIFLLTRRYLKYDNQAIHSVRISYYLKQEADNFTQYFIHFGVELSIFTIRH